MNENIYLPRAVYCELIYMREMQPVCSRGKKDSGLVPVIVIIYF